MGIEIDNLIIVEKNGYEKIEISVNKERDPDTRVSFYDFAGNYWAVSTQTNSH